MTATPATAPATDYDQLVNARRRLAHYAGLAIATTRTPPGVDTGAAAAAAWALAFDLEVALEAYRRATAATHPLPPPPATPTYFAALASGDLVAANEAYNRATTRAASHEALGVNLG